MDNQKSFKNLVSEFPESVKKDLLKTYGREPDPDKLDLILRKLDRLIELLEGFREAP